LVQTNKEYRNFMKKHALAVFRQPPEHLNCAQSVLHAWRESSGDTSIALADLKSFGGGRAPKGLCGALHAACTVVPAKAEELKARFAVRMGSLYCKELREAGEHPCADCVGQAAELLELRTEMDRSEKDNCSNAASSKSLTNP
jgi:hypothetical protein